jgi:hypothetical protein
MTALLDLQSGPDEDLDEAATEILLNDRWWDGRRARPGLITAERQLEYPWLSPDQLTLRESREVLNAIGYVGEYRQQGLYRRAYNPLINRRPTMRWLHRQGMDPWNQFIWEEFDNPYFRAGWWKPRYRGEKMDDGSRFHRRFYP